MNLAMIVAGFFSDIFGAGGTIARGLLSGAVGIGSVIANMMYFQDWMAQGLIAKFMDMSDASVWGTMTVHNGVPDATGFWNIALLVYKAVAVVGFGLFLAYWLINVIEKSNQDRLNGNEFARLGIQLIVGMALIIYGPVLMHGISQFSGWSINVVIEGMKGNVAENSPGTAEHSTGNAYLDNSLQWMGFRKGKGSITSGYCGENQKCDLCYIFAESSSGERYSRTHPKYGYVKNTFLVGSGGTSLSEKDLKAAWNDYGIGDAIGKMLMGIIVLVIQALFVLVTVVLLIIIGATALSRSIQIIIYVMFAPLAFADTFHQGFINSKSWRYIQKFLALCIQAGIIYASVILAPKIATTLGNSIVGFKDVSMGGSTFEAADETIEEMLTGNGTVGGAIAGGTMETLMGTGAVVAGTGELAVEMAGSLLGAVITAVFNIIGYLTALGLSQKAAQISNDIVGV